MTGAAGAQSYPDRLVRIIVPQGPGGPTDLLARVAAQRLQAVLRPERHHREPRRRRRRHRRESRRQRRARRLHAVHGQHQRAGAGPDPVAEAGYDPAKLFTPVARLAESYQVLVVHPSLPVKTGRRTRGLCKGQSRQAELRIGRDRQHDPSRRRAVQCRRRHQDRPRALQLRRGSDHGGARRPGPDDVRQHHRTAAADRRRQAARARGHQSQAAGAAAGRADHDRERLSRLRGARVLRHRGADRNAGTDRRQAQRHHQCRDDVERDADHAQAAGRRRPARERRPTLRRSSRAERRRWSAVAKAANISID